MLRDEGEAYANKLREAGVDVTATRYEGVIHDFVMLNALRGTNGAKAAIPRPSHTSRKRSPDPTERHKREPPLEWGSHKPLASLPLMRSGVWPVRSPRQAPGTTRRVDPRAHRRVPADAGSSASGRRTKAGSSPSYNVSCALRPFSASSRSPRTIPNTAWGSLPGQGSGVGGELRELLARRVVAVEQRGHRPRRDVLDEARQQAAEDRWPRQGRLESRVCGAQDRAVLHVEHKADGLPVVAARHELAQDLHVVVLGVEQAFVEWLLEGHHHRRDRARNPPLKLVCSIGQASQGFWLIDPMPTNASITDLPLRRLGGTGSKQIKAGLIASPSADFKGRDDDEHPRLETRCAKSSANS